MAVWRQPARITGYPPLEAIPEAIITTATLVFDVYLGFVVSLHSNGRLSPTSHRRWIRPKKNPRTPLLNQHSSPSTSESTGITASVTNPLQETSAPSLPNTKLYNPRHTSQAPTASSSHPAPHSPPQH